MKKLILAALCLLLITSPVLAGTTSTNGYFYMPLRGASGSGERTTWVNTQEATDAIIKTNVDKTTNATHTGEVTGSGALSITESALQENGTSELLGETLGTDCAENEILKTNASGGLDCAADAGGSEVNNLETITTDIAVNEVPIGTAGNTVVYKLLPDCNIAGSAMNYEDSTQVWSCRSGLGGGSFDSTTVDDTTWSDNANATNTWTFDVSGTDHTMVFGSAIVTFSNAVTITGALIANSYGGITEANLVDKSAAETIAGAWNLGTPSAAVLTNATGLPISSGVSGLGTNVATFLATPTSSNFIAAITGETGTGAAVFGTAPTFTTSISFNAVTDTVASIENQNLLDKTATEVITGVWDFGGAASLEGPNSATPTTDATGEFALDTTITDHQPLWQYFDGGENMTMIAIDTSQLPALDNEIVKYDAASDKFILEADAGGAQTFSWILEPQKEKLPTSAPMGIDAGNSRWRGLFDDTVTDESGTWERILFPYQGGTFAAKIFYTLETTSTTDIAAFDLLIECKSDGDATFDTDSFGTTNSIDSAAQSLTAGVLDVLTDLSLNEDACAEFDHITIKVFRDVSADGVIDDIELRKVIIYEL